MPEKFNQIGWTEVKDLEAEFVRAVAELRQMDRRTVRFAFEPVLSDRTISRIIAGDPVKDDTKRKLIHCIDKPRAESLYEGIAVRVQRSADKLKILEDFSGGYTYFIKEFDGKDFAVKPGTFVIFPDGDGSPTFVHRSTNWDKEEQEYTGFVLFSDSKLFLVGTKKGVIRQTILDVRKGHESDPMLGITMSIRSSRPFEPYSAKLVVFRDSDQTGIEELRVRKTRFEDFFDKDAPDYIRI